MEMFEGESSDLTRASHGRSGSDDDYCRGLHLRSLVFDPDTKTKEQGLSAVVTESLSFILSYGLVFSIFIKGLDRCVVEKLDDGIPME